MPGRRPGAGFATRTANVSRQLTDAERSVHGEVDSALASRPIHISSGMGDSAIMDQLDRQLQFNDKLGRIVAGRQSMAYAQSGRIALADQAIQDDNDNFEANEAGFRISEMIKGGTDAGDAIYEEISANPNLIHTDHGRRIIDSYKALGRTPQQREMDETKRMFEENKLANDLHAQQVLLKTQGSREDVAINTAEVNRVNSGLMRAESEIRGNQTEGHLRAYGATLEAQHGAMYNAAKAQGRENEFNASDENQLMQQQMLENRARLQMMESERVSEELAAGDFRSKSRAMGVLADMKNTEDSPTLKPDEFRSSMSRLGVDYDMFRRLGDKKQEVYDQMKILNRGTDEEKQAAEDQLASLLSPFWAAQDDLVPEQKRHQTELKRNSIVTKELDKIESSLLVPGSTRDAMMKGVMKAFTDSKINLRNEFPQGSIEQKFINARFDDITRYTDPSTPRGEGTRALDARNGWLATTFKFVNQGEGKGYKPASEFKANDPALILSGSAVFEEAKDVMLSATKEVEDFLSASPEMKQFMLAKYTYIGWDLDVDNYFKYKVRGDDGRDVWVRHPDNAVGGVPANPGNSPAPVAPPQTRTPPASAPPPPPLPPGVPVRQQ